MKALLILTHEIRGKQSKGNWKAERGQQEGTLECGESRQSQCNLPSIPESRSVLWHS